jgi:heat shock protein HtpX
MWEQIRANQRRSLILAGLMAALFFAVGWFLGELLTEGGGLVGLFCAFVIWMILALVSYYNGASIFLAASRARKIGPQDHPVLFNVVEEMTIAAGLPKMPDIYIVDDEAPNAFATGRDPKTASVAVTAGLLERLNRDELQGVIAHELGHIKNRDILYLMMIGVMMGAIVLVADIGLRAFFYGGLGRRRTSSRSGGGADVIILLIAVVAILLASVLAQIIYFAISRKREYLADASGAQFTRYPEGLASALEKISGSPQKMANVSRVTAPSYIVNPVMQAKGGGEKTGLFSTHPPTGKRIRILRSMGGGAGFADYDSSYRQVTGRPVGVIPAGSLRAAERVEVRQPGAADGRTHLDRVRETTDMLWRMNQYVFIPCACGTKLKVPPEFAGQTIACPHCGAQHEVGLPAA